MRPFQTIMLSAVVGLLVGISAAFADDADLVLRDGKIVTLDDGRPVVAALAVRGDTIVAIGTEEEIDRLIGETTVVVELDGRVAIPGFIEGHGHFTSLGQSKTILDLTGATDWSQIVEQVERAAAKTPAGGWIVGRGWHQAKWTARPEDHIGEYPTHHGITRAAPNHPVMLTHASGHMCIANREAMRRAGITPATASPPGGEIITDDQGMPTGLFRETAQGLIRRAQEASLPPRDHAQRTRALMMHIEMATRECLAHGVTSFQDAGSPFSTIDAFKVAADQGRLKVRLWVMVRESNEAMARRLSAYRMVGAGDNHLTVRAIKRSIDGALGAHGAWLLEPYDDLPASIGLNTESVESIRESAKLAVAHDCQLCVHAIGDRANRETLDLFEEIFRRYPTVQSRRWRIEHAQHLHPDDVPRFAKLGVIASMQGIHCTSDAPYVAQRLGMRRAAEGAYVWRRLLDSGAIVTNGTDTPVEPVDPIKCFYASVTRKLPSGVTFFPAQKMTRIEALRSYTIDAAYAAFEEHRKGSLSPGKLADIVVLSKDITAIPEEEILDTRVVYTIVGGKILYNADRGSTR